MKDLTGEQIAKAIDDFGLYPWGKTSLGDAEMIARIVIAADRAINAPADRDVMRAPEGWKWVPIEPTQAMCQAAQESLREWPKFPFRVGPAYKVMLAAAPTPPAEQQGHAAVMVGDSRFESWLSEGKFITEHWETRRYTKQDMREAYEAGMNDPLVSTETQEPAPVMGGRESVEDALDIVESFGPGIDGLNDTFARQIILADEVKRLRGLYESAVQGRKDFRDALRAEQQGEQEPAGYANGDELSNMLDDRTCVIFPKIDGFHRVAIYTRPAPDVLAALRAEVERLEYSLAFVPGKYDATRIIEVSEVLALINKMGGKV